MVIVAFILSSILFFILSGWRMSIINTSNQTRLLAHTNPENTYSPNTTFLFLMISAFVITIAVMATSISIELSNVIPSIGVLLLWFITLVLTTAVVLGLLFAAHSIFKNTQTKHRLFRRKPGTPSNDEDDHNPLFIEDNPSLELLQTHDDEDESVELFENALSLFSIEISECLIPRKEIVGIELTDSFEEIKQTFIDSKHSKLIVYENDMDNIIGYIHHSDFYSKPESIKELVREIPTVPQTMTAIEMLSFFKRKQKSIAWVVDEFGGTEGILTTEDLLEELFGEIQDEHDESEYIEQQIASNEYILSGRLEVEYINDKFDLEIPTESAETLSGYIIEEHNEIPNKDEKIVIDNYEFKILQVTKTRIETVKLKVLN